MAVPQELLDFVKEGLSRGMTRDAMTEVLGRAGWPNAQVSEALHGYADLDSPVPVPRPRPYVSAREVFTYLLLFASLYLSGYTLGALLFELIDVGFPDPASRRYYEYVASTIRWWISLLLVAFPLFVFVAAGVGRDVRNDPSRRTSRIRRQLTYLTLFIASLVLIGDATTLIYNVLGGELTTRFVLKVLVLGAIAGSAFGYFLWDVRTTDAGVTTGSTDRHALAGSAVAVTLAVAAGLWVIGSPAAAREARFDKQRVAALDEISRAVDVYFSRNSRLPGTLIDLRQASSAQVYDPATGTMFDYVATGERSYELCATFYGDSGEVPSTFWWHPAGRQCYRFAVREGETHR